MNRFILLILMSFAIRTSAQFKLTGKITDQQNNPIELATIKLEGLNRIAMSNDSGYFHMSLPANTKKGDALTISAAKDGFTNAVKHIRLSDSSVVIILNDSSPAKWTKPIVIKKNTDTNYTQNKAFAVRQTGAGTTSMREMTGDDLKAFYYSLPHDKSKRINITCISNDAEALRFATSIHDDLVLNGYKNVSDVLQANFLQSFKGQFFKQDTNVLTITIGHKP